MSRKLFNTHKALQLLEDEGSSSLSWYCIQPPGYCVESEEDIGGGKDNHVNYLSGIQLLAEADVKIEYGDGHTFNTVKEDEIKNDKMNNDSSVESTDYHNRHSSCGKKY